MISLTPREDPHHARHSPVLPELDMADCTVYQKPPCGGQQRRLFAFYFRHVLYCTSEVLTEPPRYSRVFLPTVVLVAIPLSEPQAPFLTPSAAAPPTLSTPRYPPPGPFISRICAWDRDAKKMSASKFVVGPLTYPESFVKNTLRKTTRQRCPSGGQVPKFYTHQLIRRRSPTLQLVSRKQLSVLQNCHHGENP